jgi:hypothetical protein
LKSKEADNFTKVKTVKFYTLGSTGFVAVTDVVRMAHELMESEIKTNFTDCRKQCFRVTF